MKAHDVSGAQRSYPIHPSVWPYSLGTPRRAWSSLAGTLTCNRLGKAPSHCLNLLYAAGRTAVLTNDPPPEETDEKAAASETSSQAVPPET